jgi:hypothetical protein
MAAKPQRFTVSFGSAGSVSSALMVGHLDARGYGVAIPSAWTAADVGFEVSSDGTVYQQLADSGGTLVKVKGIGTAAARVYSAPAECWIVGTYQYLRLASINTASDAYVNQGDARTVEIITTW